MSHDMWPKIQLLYHANPCNHVLQVLPTTSLVYMSHGSTWDILGQLMANLDITLTCACSLMLRPVCSSTRMHIQTGLVAVECIFDSIHTQRWTGVQVMTVNWVLVNSSRLEPRQWLMDRAPRQWIWWRSGETKQFQRGRKQLRQFTGYILPHSLP